MSVHAISWVLRYSPIDTPGHRLVLIVLADHAKADGSGAFPSVATIAGEARLSTRNVQYALRALEQAGAIAKQGTTRHGTAIWQLIMDRGDDYRAANWTPAAEPKGAQNLHPPPPQQGAQPLHPRGATLAPEPSENRQGEPSDHEHLGTDGSRAGGASLNGHRETWQAALADLATGTDREQLLAAELDVAAVDGHHWTLEIPPHLTTSARRRSSRIRAALEHAGADHPTIEVRPRAAAGQPAGARTP